MGCKNLGIDATNIGGGGGITHLKEILAYVSQEEIGNDFETIVVFGSKIVLDQIEDFNKLKKVTFPSLNKGLLWRVYFQLLRFDREIEKYCDILFSVTGDYVGKFKPVVGMSRNMLLYERDIWREIKQPKEIFRFYLNFLKQKRCFKNALGVIFISAFAKQEVSKQLDLSNKELTIIHHGVSPRFESQVKPQESIAKYTFEKPFKFLYVSTVHIYKHQWNVIEAIANLRSKGYPLVLDLVGGIIFDPAGEKLKESINRLDSKQNFIHYHGHVSYENIDAFYKKADGIIYASTCENMPNILIESMASGLPIACSSKQPMPEFLKDNGFYFDSKNIASIEQAIEELILGTDRRKETVKNNIIEIENYSWLKTTKDTVDFLNRIYNQYYNNCTGKNSEECSKTKPY